MKIAVFTTDDFIPPVGGAEVALGEIIQRLPDIEFDVYCAKLFADRPQTQRVGNATIYRFGFGYGLLDKLMFLILAPFAAAKRHKQSPYDLGWSMMASWGGLVAMQVQRRAKLPYVLTLQEGDSLEELDHKTRFIRPWFRQIFSRAAAVQAISTYLERWGRSMGFTGNVSRVIPNGVDVQKFEQDVSAERRAEVRQSFGFPMDAKILVTASRFVKKNGVQDVIEALPQLPSNVCFLICGFGPLEQILRERVDALGLKERVKFMGRVTHQQLPEILHASDMFIRASLTEGLGNSFLEAMACTMPVIATPVGGIPDFLIDGETGFYCQPSDPGSVAQAIQRVLSLSPEAKQTICDRARQMVRDRFSWDVVTGRMRSLFEDMVHGRRQVS